MSLNDSPSCPCRCCWSRQIPAPSFLHSSALSCSLVSSVVSLGCSDHVLRHSSLGRLCLCFSTFLSVCVCACRAVLLLSTCSHCRRECFETDPLHDLNNPFSVCLLLKPFFARFLSANPLDGVVFERFEDYEEVTDETCVSRTGRKPICCRWRDNNRQRTCGSAKSISRA